MLLLDYDFLLFANFRGFLYLDKSFHEVVFGLFNLPFEILNSSVFDIVGDLDILCKINFILDAVSFESRCK